LNDGGQERVFSFASGVTAELGFLSSFAQILSSPFSGSEKLDTLLMELKQAKEVVSRTQAAM
jgi:hypothetical protein